MTFEPEFVLSQLTTEEKISLTSAYDLWHTPAIERLNVPSIRFSDGPSGLRGTRFFNSVPSAVFPCGTALAATFNKNLLRNAGELMAAEAKSKGIHVILGPTINLLRSPLYGRGFEAYGEDPYLTGLVASEIILGIQSKKVIATLKHFVCNEIEDQRLASNSILTNRALREVYLKPFEIAIKNANPGVIMTSYNKINGVHCSNSKTLIEGILRNEWGYNGLVISDWGGTYSIKESLEAGLDLEFPGPPNMRRPDIIKHMLVSMELNPSILDDTVLRVLKTIAKCVESGIPSNGKETTDNNTKSTSKQLRELGSDGIVLLKNDNDVLPLNKTDDIAIIGPNALTSCYCGGGSAALRPYYKTTIYDSIKEYVSSSPEYTVGCYSFKLSPEILLHKDPGLRNTGFELLLFDKPVDDNSRIVLERCYLDSTHIMFGDYGFAKYENLDYCADILGYWKCEHTGEYDIGLSVVGSAKIYVNDELILQNETKRGDKIGFFTQGLREKHAIVKAEAEKVYKIFVEFETPKRLPFKVDSSVGAGLVYFGMSKVIDQEEEIKKAQKIAASHEKVIICIGLNQEWESEGFDRTSMELPGFTDKLVTALLEVNRNCIIINQSGTPVQFPWLDDASTLIQAWYGGNELGNSIVDVLFGLVNPSGKLPMTFPYKCSDNPTYLTYKTDGGNIVYGEDIFVGYKYYDGLRKKVAFPFGFGLSYTKFKLENLQIGDDSSNDDILVIGVDVINIGNIEGAEVVQIYTSFNGNMEGLKLVKQFRDFCKIIVKPEETAKVTFKLSKEDISTIWDDVLKGWKTIPGEYSLFVGDCSSDLNLKTVLNLKCN